jgi:hypothetical protein
MRERCSLGGLAEAKFVQNHISKDRCRYRPGLLNE